ncbi:MAG: hypothetical protein JNJ43_17885, partial [Anaerolineales bacterium]|nr:hypothetical protein [Anaerolineales bacterium]
TNRTVMGGGNDGGAIYHTGGPLSITNSSFTGNYTQDNGGAIYINNGTGTMTITGTSFTNQNNAAIDDGGAIYLNNGTLTINGGSFTGNSADGIGGAIYVAGGTLTIGTTTGVTFTSNSADDGGAIYHDTDTLLTISNSTFTTNSATTGDGGAIALVEADGSGTISNTTFTGNTAADDGGAIFNQSDPFTITGSTFANNSTSSASGGGPGAADGGAIYNDGEADGTTIRLSTFTGNSTTHTNNNASRGGAIYNDGSGFILANVTFSGNSANETNAVGGGNAQGGAVWTNANTTIHNVTFSGNSASESGTGTADGGNLYRAGGTVTVRNTILNNGTQNGSADNCGGTLGPAALNSNFADNISFSATDCGASVTNSNPLLGALTGSPAYFPISATSPARNNGVNAICATATTTNNESQNGLTRPQDTNCEIGSYEFPPNTPPTGTDNTITINEDTSHTFAAADFGFTDADAGDTMSAVRVDTLSLPVGSTLQLSSVNVTAGQVILTANIPNLVFTPATNANGTGYASFTFSVRDTNGPAFDTTPNTMTFNVTAVNDQPSFTASNPSAVNEDSGIQVVLWAVPDFGPPDEDSSQAVVQYIISNSTCGTLLSAGPSVNPSGQLTYTPAADQNGTCTFDVQVQDNGGIANGGVDTSLAQNFTITVNAVNDVPSFTASNPPAVNEDAGAQTVAGWVTAFNPGPANESGQAVSQYIISNSTCGTLLSAGPSVDTSGTLTYTPAADQNGTCTFDVQVQDNGGTANGGVDTSPAQNFTITVNVVNDAPSFTASNPPAVNEDAGAQTVAGWATFSAGPADESGQTVVGYTVSNSTCGSLLTADPVVNNAGDLSYTPAANQNGTCTFDVVVEDNGGIANGGVNTSAPQNFTVTVNAVNDEPSF